MYTLEDTIKQLNAAVQEYGPAWVDPNYEEVCKYVYEKSGKTRHCLIGLVVEKAMSLAHELKDPEVVSMQPIVHLYWDERSISALSAAQSMQDSGYTWGECLEHVKSVFLEGS